MQINISVVFVPTENSLYVLRTSIHQYRPHSYLLVESRHESGLEVFGKDRPDLSHQLRRCRGGIHEKNALEHARVGLKGAFIVSIILCRLVKKEQ